MRGFVTLAGNVKLGDDYASSPFCPFLTMRGPDLSGAFIENAVAAQAFGVTPRGL
jgi:hypothetical protein